MSAFDKVIGYDSIKEELLQVCDMLRNPEIYEKLGAKLPHGILLEGEPGMGKTLLAECFIEECGLPAYILRRTKPGERFSDAVSETFEQAKQSAPSVILLDDLDKFANEDERHPNAAEYVIVQSEIDEVRDSGVVVIATANNTRVMPESLLREGRFDRRISVERPGVGEGANIVRAFLSGKKLSENVNMDDVVGMIPYDSCAKLEAVINDAAAYAAYDRRDSIGTDDILKAVLKREYGAGETPGFSSEEAKRKAAVHEAGHAVMAELISPGCVKLASIWGGKDERGFVTTEGGHALPTGRMVIALAGKAAVEMFYPGTVDDGAGDDLNRACRIMEREILPLGGCGLGMIEIRSGMRDLTSEEFRRKREETIRTELEIGMRSAQKKLSDNREFLEKLAEALEEKGTLLMSDISAIRESVYGSDDEEDT